VNVKELAAELADRLERPFSHADMNDGTVDWQSAYDAMRCEIDENDYPMAVVAFLNSIAGIC
jgi:hypothetical protein